MIPYPPKTIEEARSCIYGSWAGNPNGNRYREGYCAWKVWPQDCWFANQCQHKNGHGINGLYCKQHAKKKIRE